MSGGMVMPKLPGVRIWVLCFAPIVGCGQGASTDDQGASDAAAIQEAGGFGADATKEPTSPDAGEQADGGTSVGQLRLFNGLCLPNSLATSGTGAVTCRILLTSVAGGCEQVGLSMANSADVAAIEATSASRILGPVPMPVCEMNQLAPDANCTAESALGWCYHHGSCVEDAGRMCAQAICTTGGFESKFISDGKYTDFSAAWLVCP